MDEKEETPKDLSKESITKNTPSKEQAAKEDGNDAKSGQTPAKEPQQTEKDASAAVNVDQSLAGESFLEEHYLNPRFVGNSSPQEENEGGEEEEEDEEGEEEEDFHIAASSECRTYPFKLKQSDFGNILTIHHTVRENNKVIRVCLGASCFSSGSSQFVIIDKRGNIFVFDFSKKCYWRVSEAVPKATVIRADPKRANIFLIGTKQGEVHKFDVVKGKILRTGLASDNGITDISFVGQPVNPPHLALIHAGEEAVLFNVDTLSGTHRLKFEDTHISLKYASYLPLSEMIFTCFTNDSVHVWSSITLNTLRVLYPLKAKERKIRLMGGVESVPRVSLCPAEESNDLSFACQDRDYSAGNILAYCYSQELNLLCLSTLDQYLVLLSRHSFDLQGLLHLQDFTLKQVAFLPKAKESLILGVTTIGQVLLIDCNNAERRLIIVRCHADRISLSPDSKLLAIITDQGEAHIWATCRIYNSLQKQEHCLQLLKSAFKQTSAVAASPAHRDPGDTHQIDEDIRKLLRRDRLISILKEYGCFPAKFRGIIWSTMLKLPGNRREFQLLLKLNVPEAVRQRSQKLTMKNETLRRYLIKIWACLAHWCKVFAYSDFLPHLIFPFVKMYPRNPLTAFEVCATLLMNHFQLWFEFHPLEPSNYLGLCYNILLHFDPKLGKFYAAMEAKPSDYAWPLLSTAFAEVFDEQQWLCLWDNILAAPLHFPIFVAVAYNMLQREVIVRLPDLDTVRHLFHEQNPVDVAQVVKKAHELMAKCPAKLHPKQFIGDFAAIPPNVYPKFLKYPGEWLKRHEQDLEALRREQDGIDQRLRELEMEENKIVQRLESGLRQEEHAKKMKEMEQLYQNILRREEERVSCQRKMLMLYQREIRNRKGQIIEKVHEADRRRKTHDLARQMESLVQNIEREKVRNDIDLAMAEDALRNEDMRLLEQKYILKGSGGRPLGDKYSDEVKKVCRERNLLGKELQELNKETSPAASFSLDSIERALQDIQSEFLCLKKSGSSS